MPDAPLLPLSRERRAGEERRAREKEAADREGDRIRRRVFWQCFALSLTGVPIYALSWHLSDPHMVDIALWGGFFVSYALPFFRWVAFHLSNSEEFGQ